MPSGLRLFGPVHLLIIASIPALAGALVLLVRRRRPAARAVRLVLGWCLLTNELIWYAYRLDTEGFRFPEALPLQLCDLALWMTALAALTLKQWCFEIGYFAGLGGSTMAVLTPELWAPFPSYPTIYFFLAHGGIIAILLFLVWADILRPQPGCVRRVFIRLNGFAALVGLFNSVFGTNYMYLCHKPASASLLDYMGPWPVYILSGELLAFALFTLLWLPFRGGQSRNREMPG